MSGNRKSAAERREESTRKAALVTGGEQGAMPGVATRFRAGQSGNPSGRPRGMASAVKSRTTPEEIAEGFMSIAYSTDRAVKASERIAALRELADRGWGKAPAFAAIEGGDPLELADMVDKIRGIADELAARRDARDAPVGDAPRSASG